MSAFIVSERTMQRVVTAMRREEGAWEDACQLGRDLYAMNHRAIEARYGEPQYVPPFEWTVQMLPDEGDRKRWCELLKALDCLLYQCSEGDVPKEALYKQLEACRNKLRAEIVHGLPEYDKAPWDGEPPAHTKRVCGLLDKGKKASAIAEHNAHVEAEFQRAKAGEVINLSDLIAASEQLHLADDE